MAEFVTINDLKGRRLVKEIIDIITKIPVKPPYANDNRKPKNSA